MSKIEDLVLSVEQMNHLKELGLNIDESSHWWVSRSKDSKGNPIKVRKWFITLSNVKPRCSFIEWDIVPTLTLQEILDMLPDSINVKGYTRNVLLYDDVSDCRLWYKINNDAEPVVECSSNTFFEATYEMLCWLLKNGYLKD